MISFAERLKQIRIETQLTQKKVANELGISITGYAGWEQGYREPSIKDIVELCKLFNVSSDYLLGIEN